MSARSFLLIILVLAPSASAAVAPLPPLPAPLPRLVAALDEAATDAIHETLAPFEPAPPAQAAADAAPAPVEPRPEAPRGAGFAPFALALGVVAGLAGALLARRAGLGANLARGVLLLALAAAAVALAWQAWAQPEAAAPWTTGLLASLSLVAGALALRRARAARPASSADPAYA